MFISNSHLILYPENPTDAIDHIELSRILRNANFIGEKEDTHRFLTGDKFLSYICFLGCSPDIELQPVNKKPYCYIEIPATTKEPVFMAGVNVKLPRCPNCKHDLQELPEILRAKPGSKKHTCRHCQQDIDLLKLNWRKSACISRTTVIVNNIYEAEAVPDEKLLELLKKSSGFPWKYCYVRTRLQS